MGRIGKPRALIRQLLPTAERANPLKSTFFSVVACLKTGLVELSHPLDQRCQARCYFSPLPALIINLMRKHMLVLPLWEDVHINKRPLSGGTFPAALEGGI
jgi:hypothetical protein